MLTFDNISCPFHYPHDAIKYGFIFWFKFYVNFCHQVSEIGLRRDSTVYRQYCFTFIEKGKFPTGLPGECYFMTRGEMDIFTLSPEV